MRYFSNGAHMTTTKATTAMVASAAARPHAYCHTPQIHTRPLPSISSIAMAATAAATATVAKYQCWSAHAIHMNGSQLKLCNTNVDIYFYNDYSYWDWLWSIEQTSTSFAQSFAHLLSALFLFLFQILVCVRTPEWLFACEVRVF